MPRRPSPYAGNREQGSNWIRKKKRQRIYARDGHRCVYCNAKPKMLTLDHIVPRARNESDD